MKTGIFASVPQQQDGSISDGAPRFDTFESFTYDKEGNEVPGVIAYTYHQNDKDSVNIRAFVFTPLDSRAVYDYDLAERDAKEALRDKWNGRTVSFADFKF